MGQSGEDRVVDYLTSHGLRPSRFTQAEMRKGKTPDFRVYQGRALAFYCEVKTKEDWLLAEALKAPPGTIFGGLRDDFTYLRLTEYIHHAAQQFAAVNPAEEYPNVLAIVANDPDISVPDLLTALTGLLFTNRRVLRLSDLPQNKIKNEKLRIHLYLWFASGATEPKHFRSEVHAEHDRTLCRLLSVDPRSSFRPHRPFLNPEDV